VTGLRARLLAAASFVLTAVAGVLLLAMMGLTVTDVFRRYVLNDPIPGAFEATEVMLALAIFAGLPLVTARGGHVQVRLVLDVLPPRARSVIDRIADLVVALLLAGAAWLLFDRADSLARFGDATVLLRIPLAPVAYALAALSAIAAVAAAARLVLKWRE
jgi:TRAP-type C4-dicarboxylate transport system permease small subunit